MGALMDSPNPESHALAVNYFWYHYSLLILPHAHAFTMLSYQQ